ncbi:MAG: AraD1 family protein [Chloroflexota bacterium]|nr:AraD1 family protein [Chloroflexota bacterium]
MRLVQFILPDRGRRVGLVEEDTVHDLTALREGWTLLYHVFREAQGAGRTVEKHIQALLQQNEAPRLPYEPLWDNRPGDDGGWLLPPLDHPDPTHCIIGGTGLTHTGSMTQRDAMHEDQNAKQTDSEKMFSMGLEGGKPAPGERGIAPECFYKGRGFIMRPHNGFLDIPSFAEDGGEEPEIVGCYIIGEDGTPYRLGFAIGDEWSDHAMEQVNYLWLAPSKLRTCAIGPELITDHPFKDIRGSCRIYRQDKTIYDSGELLTGEEHMSHSLANLEDHHFKHPQFRVPGDVHLYFFGTSKFSFGNRGPLADGDRIEIEFSGMGAPLVNYVRRIPPDDTPIIVRKG